MSISGVISEFRTDTGMDKGVIGMNTAEIRKQKIIDAVLKKEKALCPGAIALIGIYGSFQTGDLCLAVCGKDHPGTIMGWCGLDGRRNHAEPEIFILLDEEYRNKGYGTQYAIIGTGKPAQASPKNFEVIFPLTVSQHYYYFVRSAEFRYLIFSNRDVMIISRRRT